MRILILLLLLALILRVYRRSRTGTFKEPLSEPLAATADGRMSNILKLSSGRAGSPTLTIQEMTSKKFRSALRLLAAIFLTVVTAVAIVEILMHIS
jgi:hypothetical protein